MLPAYLMLAGFVIGVIAFVHLACPPFPTAQEAPVFIHYDQPVARPMHPEERLQTCPDVLDAGDVPALFCTREAGHAGWHEASTGRLDGLECVIAVWDRANVAVAGGAR